MIKLNDQISMKNIKKIKYLKKRSIYLKDNKRLSRKLLSDYSQLILTT